MHKDRAAIASMAFGVLFWTLCTGAAIATPTELFNIPTTDTQAPTTPHADLVYTAAGTGGWDIGALAGLSNRSELAFDYVAPGHPTQFVGAKWRLVNEGPQRPAVAVGVLAWSPADARDSANQLYVVFGEHFGAVRLTAGAYKLAGGTFTGESGLIVGLDGNLGKRWSATLDTTTGSSSVALSTIGFGYQLTPQININPGYVFQNNPRNGPNAFQVEIHADL